MTWLRRALSHGRLERELDAELRFHFERAVADAIRAGMSEAEARRAVRLEWGGVEQLKEECREARGTQWLAGTLADLRLAWRGMRKSPGFAVAAVCVLALGIGGNTAMFSVVNATFFRPLPLRDSNRLVFVSERTSQGFPDTVVPAAEFAAWKRSGVFDAVVGFWRRGFMDLTLPGRPTQRLDPITVTPGLFSELGVEPQLGRDFRPEESEPGHGNVAILGDALWRRSFGASRAAIGATVRLDGTAYTIVGVMPRGFVFPDILEAPDLYIPVATPAAAMATSLFPFLCTIGRLRPGIGMEQAQAQLQRATDDLDVTLPGWRIRPRGTTRAAVTPLQPYLAGNSHAALALLTGAAICMLLIACANVANLFLARAMTREKEVAARAALGASHLRLLRLLLSESLLVAALGGAMAVALACLAMPALGFLLPRAIPQASPLDWRALAVTAASTLCAAIIVGLAPALTACRMDLNSAMREGGPHARSRASRGGLRASLAVAQLAISLALLAGAGLLLRSFVKLVQDVGFDPQNLAISRLELGSYKHPYSVESSLDYFHRLLDAVRVLPGVETAALGNFPPMCHPVSGIFGPLHSETTRAAVNAFSTVVTPGYFTALRIPLLAGRAFRDSDKLGSARVVILSQRAARQLFGSADPIGQRITGFMYAPDGALDPHFTVVGVVGNVRNHAAANEYLAEVYQPFEQAPSGRMNVIVRSRVDPSVLGPSLAQAVQSVDPAHRLPPVERPGEMLSESLAERRQHSLILGAFAALSLLVAVVGVYGVVAYSVARRTHEIGIRMTLGAQPRDVRYMVLREGLRLALAGSVAGLALALGLSRTLASFLFGVGPWDAPTFAIAAVTLAAAVSLASYLPARQATRVNPAAALRRD
jgi:putative ABC transport system permease protein